MAVVQVQDVTPEGQSWPGCIGLAVSKSERFCMKNKEARQIDVVMDFPSRVS